MIDITPTDRAKAIVSRMANHGGVVSADPLALEQMITEAIQAESNAQLMRGRAADRQADVAAFIRKFGQARRESPGWPEQRDLDMRVRLIAEEFREFLKAAGYECILQIERPTFDPDGEPYGGIIVVEREEDDEDPHFGMIDQQEYEREERDLIKAADGLVDMEYVILGTHVTMGIDSRPLWDEVNKANMAKEGGATREDGKICKPPGFKPPDIAACLRAQGWSDELSETERGDKGFGSTGR